MFWMFGCSKRIVVTLCLPVSATRSIAQVRRGRSNRLQAGPEDQGVRGARMLGALRVTDAGAPCPDLYSKAQQRAPSSERAAGLLRAGCAASSPSRFTALAGAARPSVRPAGAGRAGAALPARAGMTAGMWAMDAAPTGRLPEPQERSRPSCRRGCVKSCTLSNFISPSDD